MWIFEALSISLVTPPVGILIGLKFYVVVLRWQGLLKVFSCEDHPTKVGEEDTPIRCFFTFVRGKIKTFILFFLLYSFFLVVSFNLTRFIFLFLRVLYIFIRRYICIYIVLYSGSVIFVHSYMLYNSLVIITSICGYVVLHIFYQYFSNLSFHLVTSFCHSL